MHADLKEMLRFFVAGALAGAVDLGVYFLLIPRVSFNLSKAISFTCAGVIAYLLNKFWIFKSKTSVSYQEIGRYILVNLLALGINVLINHGILKFWPQAVLLSWIIAAMVTGLVTFLGFKWLVFRYPK